MKLSKRGRNYKRQSQWWKMHRGSSRVRNSDFYTFICFFCFFLIVVTHVFLFCPSLTGVSVDIDERMKQLRKIKDEKNKLKVGLVEFILYVIRIVFGEAIEYFYLF